ncbi:uncharacterized protein [Drosophila takahashii]|uniref:uncharacterized protein n=1 Tax=Drosophila takahashii TaxID=29030 RepID=UPI003898EB5D
MHNLILSLFLVMATTFRQSHSLEDELFCPLIQQARLQLLCGGVYNIDLFLKYRDSLTSINAPYKIFYHIQTGFYFLLVSFNESPVQSCNNSIQLNDALDFFCGDDESPLRLPNSQIFCHRNIMSYVDDLMFECTQPRVRHFLNGQWQGEAAIHYAPRKKITHKLASAAGRPAFGALLTCLVFVLLQK